MPYYARRYSAAKGVRAYPPTMEEVQQLYRERAIGRAAELEQPDSQEEFIFGNKELPAFEKKQEIINAVRDHQVTIVMGPTGSGKSTQVPQFLLEAGHERIVVTQPRILAANGVATRIADELECAFGERQARDIVAIQTSEQNTATEHTHISIMTDGLEVVRQLEMSDDDLANEVLIIDEVHEWNENIELVIASVKRLVAKKPQLRVVIMSATIAGKELADYFGEVTSTPPPLVEIEGRTHPVERREMPESTQAEQVKKAVAEGANSILVFVPGKREIEDMMDSIHDKLGGEYPHVLLPLHAKMTAAEQNKIYGEYKGIKIIVATNVAQTSITIPGVDYVIDCGEERRVELDEEATEGLVRRSCSRDDIDQRAGRTGRDCPGIYILTKYDDDSIFVPYSERPHHAPPEILTKDLSRSILRTAMVGIDFAELDLFHKVSPAAIKDAQDKLFELGAIDENDEITEIGRAMNMFPLGTTYGRMMAEAIKPGTPERIAIYTAAIVAAFEAGGLRSFTGDDTVRATRERFNNPANDALLELNMFLWAGVRGNAEDEAYRLASQGYDVKNVAKARRSFRKVVRKLGMNPYLIEFEPPNGNEIELVNECIIAGYIDSIYKRESKTRAKDKAQYQDTSNPDAMSRVLSNRSIVQGSPTYVGAVPRYYYTGSGEAKRVKHDILENVVQTTKEHLGKIGVRFAERRVLGHRVVGGQVMQDSERVFHGISIGNEEQPLEWKVDKGVQKVILDAMLSQPGEAQQHLRDIKKELEELRNLTKEKLPEFTQDNLIGWLKHAINLARSTTLSDIEAHLWAIISEQGFTIDSILPAERRQAIREAAVSKLQITEDLSLTVEYRRGQPWVRSLSEEEFMQLPDKVSLPDGRHVWFRVPKTKIATGSITAHRLDGYVDLPAQRAKEVVLLGVPSVR